MIQVTRILQQINSGNEHAAEQLLPIVYEELRRLAKARMAAERIDHTLQATALVHEAYLRLVDRNQRQNWDSLGHFFAAAAEAMRRILVEQARRRQRIKHGGAMEQRDLDVSEIASSHEVAEILSVHDSLDALAKRHCQAAELVKLRYFVGLTIPEAADVLGISPRTAYNLWSYARACLLAHLSDDAAS